MYYQDSSVVANMIDLWEDDQVRWQEVVWNPTGEVAKQVAEEWGIPHYALVSGVCAFRERGIGVPESRYDFYRWVSQYEKQDYKA